MTIITQAAAGFELREQPDVAAAAATGPGLRDHRLLGNRNLPAGRVLVLIPPRGACPLRAWQRTCARVVAMWTARSHDQLTALSALISPDP